MRFADLNPEQQADIRACFPYTAWEGEPASSIVTSTEKHIAERLLWFEKNDPASLEEILSRHERR